ncbi:MAG: BMP family ABC transporter substrate-binding protein [Spirochaetia bacterium]|jgi:basic membrane lipoprotein Med (substrate-binding protein (PBP1-ABC) superfamily)|uniref:Membrane lipoprotein TpN38(B) n=1 Tax=uncultured spirochete TaxID=156406 RepID=A0A3P3XGC1_9SPIR|nr:BMP family ABC transporter substrate-binding protein [Rectinema subterraneum]MDQ7795441.1 BMP family ABC transporter substrate-binding protein [Spirochaetia bacterium]SLM10869.1 Membrane lipoprotein TpN38(b) [uncultured spirochete]
MRRFLVAFVLAIVAGTALWAQAPRIGVFIPGVREGSPIYDTMAKGAERLAAEISGASIKIFEAGFNQAEWEEKLTSFVASGKFDIVITSNPSMPELVNNVSKSFPKQKFICLDGYLPGNPNVYSALYNQLEQGYVTGYLAGLVSISGMKGTNPDKKIGMIIGQNYPVMDKMIIPGFMQGLKAADPAFQLDIRVLGNWYDAAKAADLSRSLYAAGADIILPICGSASQGAVKVAQETGKYLVFFDDNEFARAPDNILGCAVLHQEDLAYRSLKAAIEGKLPFGKADVVGMKEGYIEFLNTNPAYIKNVPEPIRKKVDAAIQSIKSGQLTFQVPSL